MPTLPCWRPEPEAEAEAEGGIRGRPQKAVPTELVVMAPFLC